MSNELNRKIYAKDCLDVLNDRDALPNASVDLIYLDPPFNSNSNYNLPFKGQYKEDSKPVMAFKDTWSWSEEENENLGRLGGGDLQDQLLADVIKLSRRVLKERPNIQISMSAYLLNMAIRLKAMKRVLKDTGSIYLHCDPTASHYLKMIMDVVFGKDNFRNEIVWRIGWVSGYKTQKRGWIRNHEIIFYYLKSQVGKEKFNKEYIPYPIDYKRRDGKIPTGKGFPIEDTWNCSSGDVLDSIMIKSFSKEKLGYPTQKPLDLLKRIIKANTDEGDVVLDPFCGCGTTVHAAEALNRKWIGIDISQFSAGLIRNRLIKNFPLRLNHGNVSIIGCPLTVVDAQELAKRDPFEFEKWACGEVGAEGLFHNPGDRGADGGVDGVINFHFTEKFPQYTNEKSVVEAAYAIVQVKGGTVTPDSVKALSTTVRESGGKGGVMICFDKYMKTVENNREKKRVKEITGDFDFIQGLSIEDLMQGKMLNLPQRRYAA